MKKNDCDRINEAFLLKKKAQLKLEINEDNIVYVFYSGTLLWHQPIFDPPNASNTLLAMAEAIFGGYMMLSEKLPVTIIKFNSRLSEK